MGYYIEVPHARGKAKQLEELHGGMIVDHLDASKAVDDPDLGVIVVLDNGLFEAAGYAYSRREFEEFTDLRDTRPKQFVVLDRTVAERLSGFARSARR